MSVLEINQIVKTFKPGTPNEVRALKGVSLTLQEGSFLIVIGTNGSGKSTLLNAIAGTFYCRHRQYFRCRQEHNPLAGAPSRSAYWPCISGSFSGTAPTMSIAENLVLASRRGKPRGLGLAVNRRSMDELRDRIRPLNMGLEDRLDNPIGSLSGGQRQALTLLMASWLKPELLLLDEHTAALDPKTADQVIQLTHEIIERDKLTTLMVTHSMQQAVNLGDRIVMMYKGNILHDLKDSERARVRPQDC